MLATVDTIKEILVCPRCRAPLDRGFRCTITSCGLHDKPFPVVSGQPALIDFDDSILDRAAFSDTSGASYKTRGQSLPVSLAMRLIHGKNQVAHAKATEIIIDMKRFCATPRLLVVGGGEVGSGAKSMYADPAVTVIGTDIYPTDHTTLLADGHHLPFADQSVDGVWIQAVLEHVLDPQQVVNEIYRVLRPNGLVFADTPFMQQVHEGAYDFTRFTLSGHRWLFRRFELIDAGVSKGAGSAALWSVRYLIRSVTASGSVGSLAQLPLFWLRYADRCSRRKAAADAASAVYFYGRRSDRAITPKEIVAFYEQQQGAR